MAAAVTAAMADRPPPLNCGTPPVSRWTPPGTCSSPTYNNDRIREVNLSTGVITTVAGGGDLGLGDGNPATAAELSSPSAIALDSAGDLFIADYGNNRVREVNLSTGTITTVAGNGSGGVAGDGAQATAAGLAFPSGVALDSAGDLFIADYANNRVREVNHATGLITTVAGGGSQGLGDDGQATAAELDHPFGVTVDSAGNLFIADSGDNRIREVNLTTGAITTVAGNGTDGYNGDNFQATAAGLDAPFGVAVDSTGDLFIGDLNNARVREVNLATGIITTVAGDGTSGYGGDGGLATAAELGSPIAVAVDSSGDLFIGDVGDSVVREVNLASGAITTVAGNGNKHGDNSGDGGPATAADLGVPIGVAVDSAGDLFIADVGNDVIDEVNLATGLITTVAGNGTTGYGGDNGPATATNLSFPAGVAVDFAGDLFIADTENGRIREIASGVAAVTVTASATTPASTTTTVAASSTTYGSDGNAALTANVTADSPSTATVNEGSVTFTIVCGSSTVGAFTSGTVTNGTVTDWVDLAQLDLSAGSYSIEHRLQPGGHQSQFPIQFFGDLGTTHDQPGHAGDHLVQPGGYHLRYAPKQ